MENKKCENCIHFEVCKFRYEKQYPTFMKEIISEKCTHYIKKEE